MYNVVFVPFSFPDGREPLPISEAVQQQKILVEQVSTSKDFEAEESKPVKHRVPSLDLTSERLPPQTTYTVTGRLRP